MSDLAHRVGSSRAAGAPLSTLLENLRALQPTQALFCLPGWRNMHVRDADAKKVDPVRNVPISFRLSQGNWRGGRTRHEAGYVMVYAPDHPRAGRSPYAFDHIMVMEHALGRHLFADETVHHKNGVRDDNRLENLELWTRPHPTGIRAADAVAWAQVILARYQGQYTSNNAHDAITP